MSIDRLNVIQIFRDVLGRDVDGEEHLATFGLDSLTAIRLLGALRERALPELGFADLLADGLRVRDVVELAASTTGTAAGRTGSASVTDRVTLRLSDGNADSRRVLSLCNAVFRLTGPLDVDALGAAVAELPRRHEALRSRFGSTGESPLVVEPYGRLRLRLVDAQGGSRAHRAAWAAGWISHEVTTVIDRDRAPLMRASLVRVADDEHHLVLVADHAISDGWSFSVIGNDLGAAYRRHTGLARSRPNRAPVFTDWLSHEVEALNGARGAELERFWKKLLGTDPDVIRARFRDIGLVEPEDYTGSAVRAVLAPDRLARLGAVAAEHGTTLFSLLATVLLRTLRPLTDNDVLCLMTTVANRAAPGAGELVGNCVNTVWIPTRYTAGTPLERDLAAFHRTMRDVLAHQDAPDRWLLDRLFPGAYKGFPDVPQVYFLYAKAWEDSLRLPGVTVEADEWEEHTAQPGLQFYATERADGLELAVHWRPGEFTETSVKSIVDNYVAAVTAL